LTLLPAHYGLLSDAATVHARLELYPRARELLKAASDLDPDRPVAYRLLAETQLLAGDGRGAHATAVEGLARWGGDRALWALLSESYVRKGDLAAAIRAREAALAVDPASERDRARLAELVEAHADARAGR
jgi:predicted Zn-dependent protease